jgi:hypothetical protein
MADTKSFFGFGDEFIWIIIILLFFCFFCFGGFGYGGYGYSVQK